eukprot:1179993-Prorocentrum_minimum.AAC.3
MVWMLRGTVWMLRAIVWMLRAIVARNDMRVAHYRYGGACHACQASHSVDVKGNSVDVKGNSVDVKGNSGSK